MSLVDDISTIDQFGEPIPIAGAAKEVGVKDRFNRMNAKNAWIENFFP
jgi:hypothetical protein